MQRTNNTEFTINIHLPQQARERLAASSKDGDPLQPLAELLFESLFLKEPAFDHVTLTWSQPCNDSNSNNKSSKNYNFSRSKE